MQETTLYAFGEFELDAREGVLRHAGQTIHLTPKCAGVLLALVERGGELVDKAQIFERVWPGTTVEECNLAQHVASLRRVLGDDAKVPTYIETVSRRGYRFVANVTRRESRPAALGGAADGPPPPGRTAEEAQPGPAALPPPAQEATLRDRAWRLRRARLASVVALAAAVGVCSAVWARTRDSARTITVLPVANLTGDPRNMHLAALLGDALRQGLTETGELQVVFGPAAWHGKADAGDGEGADAIVESALVRAGERVQVVLELIEGSSDALLWADVLEVDRAELRGLESQMAEAVLSRLRSGRGDRVRPAAGPTAAHREHALARYYLSQRTPQVLDESLEHFSTAVELDPGLASAHAGLAEAYLLASEQRTLDPGKGLRLAEAAARRAGELQPSLAEASLVDAAIAEARSDLPRALQLYEGALALDRLLAKGHERLGRLLIAMGRGADGLAEARKAVELDPSAPGPRLALALACLHEGRHEDAAAHATAALRLHPHLPEVYEVLGRVHQAAGRHAEGALAYEQATLLSDRHPRYLALWARALASQGAFSESRRMLRELEQATPRWRISPVDLAPVLAALGEPDRAHQVLQEAADSHEPWLAVSLAGLRSPELEGGGRLERLLARVRRDGEQGDGSSEVVRAASLDPGALPTP